MMLLLLSSTLPYSDCWFVQVFVYLCVKLIFNNAYFIQAPYPINFPLFDAVAGIELLGIF